MRELYGAVGGCTEIGGSNCVSPFQEMLRIVFTKLRLKVFQDKCKLTTVPSKTAVVCIKRDACIWPVDV